MGRWQGAWFDVLNAYTADEISLKHLNAITARLAGIKPTEESLALLRSSLAAAKVEHASANAVAPGPGTEAATPESAPDTASLEAT